MSTGMKVAGVIGTGIILSLGASAYEPTTSVTPSSSTVTESIKIESVPETKQEDLPTASNPSTESVLKPKTVPTTSKPTSSCHPSYSGCLKMNAGDYDCASGSGNGPNYTGAVQVYGADPFDLDRDNDGWGCE